MRMATDSEPGNWWEPGKGEYPQNRVVSGWPKKAFLLWEGQVGRVAGSHAESEPEKVVFHPRYNEVAQGVDKDEVSPRPQVEMEGNRGGTTGVQCIW